MLEYDRAIGERLRQLRRQRGLTMAEVEALSDGEFRQSALGAYERGNRTLTVPRLERLAALYRVPVGAVLPSDDGDGEAPTRRTDDAATPAPRRRADAGNGRRLCIDVVALERAAGDLDPLRGYVRTVCRQRGVPGAAQITLRGEDLQPVAALCGMEPLDAVLWLHHLGVLSRPALSSA